MTDADVIIHAMGSSASLAGLSAMEKDEGLSVFSRSCQQFHPSLGEIPTSTVVKPLECWSQQCKPLGQASEGGC